MIKFNKKICIIVLNWNGKDLLKNCLQSLINSTYKNREIFVVDNFSTDGSREYVKTNFKKIHLIENKENLGWTGGNNIGIKEALKYKPDAIMLLNNDIVLTSSFMEPLVAELFKSINIGIVGPILFTDKSRRVISDAGGMIKHKRYFCINRGSNELMSSKYTKNTKVDFVIGASMLIKSEVFRKIGVFNNKYFIYYDDSDFCQRAKKAGFYSYVIPGSVALHKGSATVRVGSPFHHYYTTRNHLLFMENVAPKYLFFRELVRIPKTIFEFLSSKDNDKRIYSLLGIRDYFLRRFGKRIYW